MVRCRTGIVQAREFVKVPDQRCITFVLHRIRETRDQVSDEVCSTFSANTASIFDFSVWALNGLTM